MSRRTPFFAPLVAIPLILPSAGAGCASKERREIVRSTAEPEERTSDRGAAGEEEREAPQAEGPYALRVNRTLLYPVQWGRAEDLAETLRPLIEASYGPGTVVVAHPESNHLLIYLPPRSAREPTRSPAPTRTTPRQVAPPFPRR